MGKKITCLFLGSGASWALANIPIQRNFLCSVLSEERAKWVDKCGIEDGIKFGDSTLSSWMLEVGDIELCMSYLHNVAYSGDLDPTKSLASDQRHPRHARRAIVNLRAAIGEFLNKMHADYQCNRLIDENCLKFIKDLFDEGNELAIFTTNYDLVVETLLNKLKVPYCYPLNLKRSSENRAVRIYKLHGSINWLEERLCKGEILESYHPPRIRIIDESFQISQARKGEEKENWAYLFWINEDKGNRMKSYNPVLIPFIFQKDAWLIHGRWKDTFTQHWDDAERFMLDNTLEKIYFFGYSMPAADHNMLRFLMNILNRNTKVTIVCRGENEITPLERVLSPFQPNVCRCGLEGFLSHR